MYAISFFCDYVYVFVYGLCLIIVKIFEIVSINFKSIFALDNLPFCFEYIQIGIILFKINISLVILNLSMADGNTENRQVVQICFIVNIFYC